MEQARRAWVFRSKVANEVLTLMKKHIASAEEIEDSTVKGELTNALTGTYSELNELMNKMDLTEKKIKKETDSVTTVAGNQQPEAEVVDSAKVKEMRFNKNSFSSFVENLPFMKGSDKLEDWIFLIDEAVKRYFIPDNEIVTVILMKLIGNALQLARKIIADSEGNDVLW